MPRGKARRSLELIEACIEILREIQPATVRAVAYRLFTRELRLTLFVSVFAMLAEIVATLDRAAWDRYVAAEAVELESITRAVDSWGALSEVKKAHPDTGGAHETFLDLQRVNQWLRLLVRSGA